MPATPPNPSAPRSVPLVKRPWYWLNGLLKRPVKLERRGLQIHVVLAEPPAPPTTPPSAGGMLRQGHAELRELLGRHPELRHVMRHLGFFEQALARSGSRALRGEVPLPVLDKALQQFELLLRDGSSPALDDLRARLERAVNERQRAAAHSASPTALQVSEASPSQFDEVERSWTGQMPLVERAAKP